MLLTKGYKRHARTAGKSAAQTKVEQIEQGPMRFSLKIKKRRGKSQKVRISKPPAAEDD